MRAQRSGHRACRKGSELRSYTLHTTFLAEDDKSALDKAANLVASLSTDWAEIVERDAEMVGRPMVNIEAIRKIAAEIDANNFDDLDDKQEAIDALVAFALDRI
jgi:hypothetical protein